MPNWEAAPADRLLISTSCCVDPKLSFFITSRVLEDSIYAVTDRIEVRLKGLNLFIDILRGHRASLALYQELQESPFSLAFLRGVVANLLAALKNDENLGRLSSLKLLALLAQENGRQQLPCSSILTQLLHQDRNVLHGLVFALVVCASGSEPHLPMAVLILAAILEDPQFGEAARNELRTILHDERLAETFILQLWRQLDFADTAMSLLLLRLHFMDVPCLTVSGEPGAVLAQCIARANGSNFARTYLNLCLALIVLERHGDGPVTPSLPLGGMSSLFHLLRKNHDASGDSYQHLLLLALINNIIFYEKTSR